MRLNSCDLVSNTVVVLFRWCIFFSIYMAFSIEKFKTYFTVFVHRNTCFYLVGRFKVGPVNLLFFLAKQVRFVFVSLFFSLFPLPLLSFL